MTLRPKKAKLESSLRTDPQFHVLARTLLDEHHLVAREVTFYLHTIQYASNSEMDTNRLLVQAQHVCQIVLSVYGFRHSYIAITNLRKYEAATKKAAKWSNEVDTQLFMTRMTQGTGFLTVRLPQTQLIARFGMLIRGCRSSYPSSVQQRSS